MVATVTGLTVQRNKAIVGRNAFAHESGIHQDGVLKERTTYEIMDATTIGLETNSLVLGKHSGRHALRNALEELGFKVEGGALNTAFKRFKEAGAGHVPARVVRHRGLLHALAARPCGGANA